MKNNNTNQMKNKIKFNKENEKIKKDAESKFFYKIISNEKFKDYFLIIFIGIILSIPLLQGFLVAHDYEPHIARVMSTVIALKSEQLIPVISPNYVNNLGYSWNLFYPPLTNYLTIICKVICNNYVQALNLFVGITIILSGIFMYQFLEKVAKSKKIALLSAIIYITVPYRISNIYIRYALGEIAAFVFIPLVFNGLYDIFEEDGKQNYLLTIGAVGLLLTHNISTLLIIITCIIFIIFNIKKLKDWKLIKKLIINALFILAIVAFFYGPMLEHKRAIHYAVFNEFTSENKLNDAQINLWEIIIGKLYFGKDVGNYNRTSVAIGLIVFLISLTTPFIYKKIDEKHKKNYLICFIMGIFCIFASSKYMPWQYMPDIFKFLQFPYRLLIISTFCLSIVTGINLGKLFKNITYKKILIIVFFCVMYVVPIMMSVQIDTTFDENMYYEIEKNELPYPGSYSKYCSTYEYLPSKAYNNLAHLFERENEPKVIVGDAEISNLQIDKNFNYTFDIKNVSTEGATIEMPKIFYLGYRVTLNEEEIDAGESNLGLVMFSVNSEEEGTIKFKYTGTNFSKFCYLIAMMGSICFIGYVVLCKKLEN